MNDNPDMTEVEGASLAVDRVMLRGKPMVQLSILTDEGEQLSAMQFTPEKAEKVGRLIAQTARTVDVKGAA